MTTPYLNFAVAAVLASFAFLVGGWSTGAMPGGEAPEVDVSSPHDGAFWIQVVPPEQATGTLAQIYEQFSDGGRVDHMIMAHSPHVESLRHVDLYRTLFITPDSVLRADETWRLATAVADSVGSLYARTHFAAALLGGLPIVPGDAEVARLTRPLNARETAMLGFARKLERAPRTMDSGDVERLRAAGFDDRQILQITLVSSYVSFTSRVALALGIPLETYWTSSHDG